MKCLLWCCAAAVLVAASSCRDSGLRSATGQVRVTPETLDFGVAWANAQTLERTVEVVNGGRATVSLRWSPMNAPFELVDPPTEAVSGSTTLRLRFRPLVTGEVRAAVSVSVDGEAEARMLAVTGRARETPACVSDSPCRSAHFDVQQEKCVDVLAPEGSACDPGTVCVVQATCRAGQCMGLEKSCDDSNACTLDVCNAKTGCEHLPAPPCPGDGACQVGVCNPASGCGLAPASDGTTCGPVQTCDAAQVCIAGACVTRDPPDGFVCAEASPCQGEGRCTGSACVRPPAGTLSTSWTYDSSAMAGNDAGTAVEELHDFVLEPQGAVTMMSFFQTPAKLRANTAAAKSAPFTSRRCALWGQRLVCMDYPAAVNGKVSALDMATGEMVWSFDARVAKPEYVMQTHSLFLARMAVLSGDRLAALYEAYPKSSVGSSSTQCRRYYLFVLDAQGKLVSAQQLQEPVLEQCNHPHPYGFAADAQGNLFMSFSPTIADPAPLVPGWPTLVLSYTRDGVFRWKFTDHALVGGELAVARGLVFAENSPIAVLASNGQPAFAFERNVGRPVVSQTRIVPSPTVGGLVLDGFESGLNTKRWSSLLTGGESYWSDQIRLASWATSRGPVTVALTFTDKAGARALRAIDVRDGREAFRCEVNIPSRTGPQLFEVADGSLALMEGSNACGKCDPPYAGSSATFHTMKVPLISVAREEPWLGAFGGAGHDHREETPVTPPTQPH